MTARRRPRPRRPGARAGALVAALPDADAAWLRAAHRRCRPCASTTSAAICAACSRAGRPIVALCAAGILIRALAPLLADKRAEPPVVAVAEDGSVAVPLLGGHHGANELARTIAERARRHRRRSPPRATCALGLALDEPPPGWRVANPAAAKPVTAALLAGAPVRSRDRARPPPTATGSARRRLSPRGERERRRRSVVTDRRRRAGSDTLVSIPPILALGVGCERGAPADGGARAGATQRLAAGRTCRRSPSPASPRSSSRPTSRRSTRSRGSSACRRASSPPQRLQAETPRLSQPVRDRLPRDRLPRRRRRRGAGRRRPGGARWSCRSSARHAPPAPSPAPAHHRCRRTSAAPRGRLADRRHRPRRCRLAHPRGRRRHPRRRAISSATASISICWAARRAARRSTTSLSAQEETRVRAALDLAAEGGDVALVSSGDAGIYAMASLVFELLERERRADWARVAIDRHARRLGDAGRGRPRRRAARPRFLRHLALRPADALAGDRAAPRGRRRRRFRHRALQSGLAAPPHASWPPPATSCSARAADTPVVIARNLGRAGETRHRHHAGGARSRPRSTC